MSERVPVYRTAGEDDARHIAGLLAESGIPSELAFDGEGEGAEAVLLVPAAAEAEAVRVIAAHLESRGLLPEGTVPENPLGALCPNCAFPAPGTPGAACGECGYAVRPPAEGLSRAREHFPDARGACADCCALSTKASGPCPDCGGALEPADLDGPLCPAGAHLLVKGDGPGWVCPGCREAWLDAAA